MAYGVGAHEEAETSEEVNSVSLERNGGTLVKGGGGQDGQKRVDQMKLGGLLRCRVAN